MPTRNLKGAERGDVDVMQRNWPCEVNVLLNDSMHIAHATPVQDEIVLGPRGLRSLANRHGTAFFQRRWYHAKGRQKNNDEE